MAGNPVTVTLPEPLLKEIRGRARRAKRTVEAEVIQLLNDAVGDGRNGSAQGTAGKKPNSRRGKRAEPDPVEDALPPDIAEAVARVPLLDDRALREAMKPLMTPKQAKRLAELNYKAQDKGLTPAEETERDELLDVYDKSMLVRAAVMAELRKRGVEVAELIAT
jgi:hypothetical protein